MSNNEEFDIDDFIIEDGVLYEYRGCDSDVVIPSIVTEINIYAFNSSFIKSVIIGDNVKEIGDSAFEGLEDLEKVTIGNGTEHIGDSAFYECVYLETVTIGSGLKTIGSESFAFCENLKNITLGASVEKIEEYAFDGCPNLVITTTAGSYAEKYARNNGIKVNLI